MGLTRQFAGGVLVGLAFGLMIGAWLSSGQGAANTGSMAGVGIMLAIIGVIGARSAPRQP
jgi:hypothetical protein